MWQFLIVLIMYWRYLPVCAVADSRLGKLYTGDNRIWRTGHTVNNSDSSMLVRYTKYTTG